MQSKTRTASWMDALLLGSILVAFVGACLVLALMAWQTPEIVRAFYQPTRTQDVRRTQVVIVPTSTSLPTLESVYTPTPAATDTITPTITWTNTPWPTPTASRVIPAASSLSTSQGARTVGQAQDKWIDIDLSEQRLTAYEGDDIVLSVLVSTGLPNTPTPIGEFRIYLRVRVQEMGGPDYRLPNVEYVSYFFKDYALHGTYWHDNFGQPMSHGCVNMRNADAQWIYNWSLVGTPVHVHN